MIVKENMKVRHKKKQTTYIVLHIGTHTETQEEMVVYESMKDGRIWIRPLEMFADGRFEEIQD